MREASIALLPVARRLAPVDVLCPPTRDDWTLFAAWHDLYVAAHPDWNTPLRRHLARRVLEHALVSAQGVGLPQTVSGALARHVWIAALRSVVRVDQTVTWWRGAETFRGVDPPARLLLWPTRRKVDVSRLQIDSASIFAGSALDKKAYDQVYSLCLALSPLTDLAVAHRANPPFAWTDASLALVSTTAGRTLVARAIRQWSEPLRAKARAILQVVPESVPKPARAAIEKLVNEVDL